jgi:DNA modification methylase
MSLKTKLMDFCNDPKTLQDCYTEFPEEKPTTIRGRLNESVGKHFHRVGKGIYIARKGDTTAIIIEGNAWEKIKDIESNTVDTIITDSPYSCLNKHLAIGTTRKKNNEWSFKTVDIDETLLKEMLRVLKPGGHFFNFLPPDGADTLSYNNNFISMAQRLGFTFNKRWIWDKVVFGMGYNGRNKYEQIIFMSKGARRKPYDLSIPDVLSHKRIASTQRIHEAEKPIELIEDILKFSNKPNDLVLDTFAGSLTLAMAGLRRKVNTISIELDANIISKALRARGLEVTL